jgi:hypothetical protein
MSRIFLDLNEKREAIRRAQERPRSWLDRLKHSVTSVLYRIRKPNIRAGVSIHSSMADAANHRDLDVIELPGYFEGERMSRGWMRHGNAAGSVVPGSYEEEVFGRQR